MTVRTLILAGVTAALGAGAALAQPAPEGAPYQQGPYQQGPYQQGPYQQGPYQQGPDQQAPGEAPSHRHHHGILAVIKEEMRAGRLSHKEGTLLVQKIRQLHAERRAEREARYGEEGARGQMQQPQ